MTPEQPKSSVLCKFYVNGVCRQGNNCQFSHDRSSATDIVCRYYLQGTCAYGDRCRYDHVRRNPSKRSVPSKQNQLQSGKAAGETETKKTSPGKSTSREQRTGIMPLTTVADAKPIQSRMVSLGKKELTKNPTKPPSKSAEDWVKAKEFIPGQVYDGAGPVSYAMAVKPQSRREDEQGAEAEVMGACAKMPSDTCGTKEAAKLLCPFFAHGMCHFGEQCAYVHGEICDMCGMAVLHPTDSSQRELHQKECVQEHERDMEHSFAVARSQGQSCGICMETVMEKNPTSERRFGILENCNHCFCLSCIRTWRCAKQFEKVIVRACPECRVKSNFVIPSQFWVDTKEEKMQLIDGYKKALGAKPCRYFDQGKGECPFNDKCFYRHALPDGTLAERKPRAPRRRVNADGEVEITMFSLWDFLERETIRRSILQSLEEELYVFMNILADSDSEETLTMFLSDQDLSDDDW